MVGNPILRFCASQNLGETLRTMITIVGIKKFTKRNLNDLPFTAHIISSEPDQVSMEIFVMKAKLWLELLEKELEWRASR